MCKHGAHRVHVVAIHSRNASAGMDVEEGAVESGEDRRSNSNTAVLAQPPLSTVRAAACPPGAERMSYIARITR